MKKKNNAGFGKKKVILLALLGIVTCCFLACMISGHLDMFFTAMPTFVFLGVFLGAPILSIIYWIRHKKRGSLIAFLLLLLLVALFSALVYFINSLSDDKIVFFLKKVRSIISIILPCLIVGQGFLMLFWKPSRKLGLWLFFITLTTLCAVVGGIVDYVRQEPTPALDVVEVLGPPPPSGSLSDRMFGNYGFVGSRYDQAKSNNQDELK